jgi:hypothetical protein
MGTELCSTADWLPSVADLALDLRFFFTALLPEIC